jgi:mRNA interferase RelE/StbE
MTWKIKILRGAIKQLEKLPHNDYKAVKQRIINLADNPRPQGYEKLKGRDGFRVRQGKYRIIYTIYNEIVTVVVLRISHRKDAYK